MEYSKVFFRTSLAWFIVFLFFEALFFGMFSSWIDLERLMLIPFLGGVVFWWMKGSIRA